MATLIKGLLSQNLPWGLVLVGVFIAVTLELCGIHSLSFAVGAYLPIATTAPIFLGGLVRWWVERKTGETSESDLELRARLFSSGLIAGGSLAGILFAILVGGRINRATRSSRRCSRWVTPCHCAGDGNFGQIAGAVFFFALAVILSRFAQTKDLGPRRAMRARFVSHPSLMSCR